jgi:hypothetical protein
MLAWSRGGAKRGCRSGTSTTRAVPQTTLAPTATPLATALVAMAALPAMVSAALPVATSAWIIATIIIRVGIHHVIEAADESGLRRGMIGTCQCIYSRVRRDASQCCHDAQHGV